MNLYMDPIPKLQKINQKSYKLNTIYNKKHVSKCILKSIFNFHVVFKRYSDDGKWEYENKRLFKNL